jgi:hypothetical protein
VAPPTSDFSHEGLSGRYGLGAHIVFFGMPASTSAQATCWSSVAISADTFECLVNSACSRQDCVYISPPWVHPFLCQTDSQARGSADRSNEWISSARRSVRVRLRRLRLHANALCPRRPYQTEKDLQDRRGIFASIQAAQLDLAQLCRCEGPIYHAGQSKFDR